MLRLGSFGSAASGDLGDTCEALPARDLAEPLKSCRDLCITEENVCKSQRVQEGVGFSADLRSSGGAN